MMSEVDTLRDKSGETDKPQPSQLPITLTIRIMPDLSCQVDGPLSDRILCYGMLESARDVIMSYQIKKSNGNKPGGIMGFARGFKR